MTKHKAKRQRQINSLINVRWNIRRNHKEKRRGEGGGRKRKRSREDTTSHGPTAENSNFGYKALLRKKRQTDRQAI